jgi:hypothetical protein
MTSATTTINAGPCTQCGEFATTRDENNYCLDCQYRSLQSDVYAGEVIEKVLGDAVAAALEYLAPSDVHEIVDKAVERTGCNGATPLAVVLERSRHIYAARHAEVPA